MKVLCSVIDIVLLMICLISVVFDVSCDVIFDGWFFLKNCGVRFSRWCCMVV